MAPRKAKPAPAAQKARGSGGSGGERYARTGAPWLAARSKSAAARGGLEPHVRTDRGEEPLRPLAAWRDDGRDPCSSSRPMCAHRNRAFRSTGTRCGRISPRHGMRLDDDPPPRQFAGGLANLNYLIHLDGKPAVLRRPPLGELPAGAYDMAREFRILSRLPDALPFVPRGLFLCDRPDGHRARSSRSSSTGPAW